MNRNTPSFYDLESATDQKPVGIVDENGITQLESTRKGYHVVVDPDLELEQKYENAERDLERMQRAYDTLLESHKKVLQRKDSASGLGPLSVEVRELRFQNAQLQSRVHDLESMLPHYEMLDSEEDTPMPTGSKRIHAAPPPSQVSKRAKAGHSQREATEAPQRVGNPMFLSPNGSDTPVFSRSSMPTQNLRSFTSPDISPEYEFREPKRESGVHTPRISRPTERVSRFNEREGRRESISFSTHIGAVLSLADIKARRWPNLPPNALQAVQLYIRHESYQVFFRKVDGLFSKRQMGKCIHRMLTDKAKTTFHDDEMNRACVDCQQKGRICLVAANHDGIVIRPGGDPEAARTTSDYWMRERVTIDGF